jgi:hypothetical protein
LIDRCPVTAAAIRPNSSAGRLARFSTRTAISNLPSASTARTQECVCGWQAAGKTDSVGLNRC